MNQEMYGTLDDEDYYLHPKHLEQIKTRGLVCARCGAVPTNQQLLFLAANVEVTCECGEELEMHLLNAFIDESNPSYQYLHNPKDIFKRTWFHITCHSWQGDKIDWSDRINKQSLDFNIHVGTEQAALDRGAMKYRDFTDVYLYEIELSPKATIAHMVRKDLNNIQVGRDTADIIRYINRWEDATSISLAVKRKHISIKNVQYMPHEELRRYLSFYNFEPVSQDDQ